MAGFGEYSHASNQSAGRFRPAKRPAGYFFARNPRKPAGFPIVRRPAKRPTDTDRHRPTLTDNRPQPRTSITVVGSTDLGGTCLDQTFTLNRGANVADGYENLAMHPENPRLDCGGGFWVISATTILPCTICSIAATAPSSPTLPTVLTGTPTHPGCGTSFTATVS